MESTSIIIMNERVREIIQEIDVDVSECLAIIKNLPLLIDKSDINDETRQALEKLLLKIHQADRLVTELLRQESWKGRMSF